MISFRRVQRSDFPLLSRWFGSPHVLPWWRESRDLDAIEARYGPPIDGADKTELFIVELDGSAIGLVQWYCMSDHPPGNARSPMRILETTRLAWTTRSATSG